MTLDYHIALYNYPYQKNIPQMRDVFLIKR